MTIKFPTRLEEIYLPELIGILMREAAFLLILSSFGEILLGDNDLAEEIENFTVNKKIWSILTKYCRKYGSKANYERISGFLAQRFGLQSLAGKVNAEGKSKQPKLVTTGTKIEHKEIPDLAKILLTSEILIGNLKKFKNLLGVHTEAQPNTPPKTQLNHTMYNFHKMFPQKATYEFLIDILEDKMALQQLADKVRRSTGYQKGFVQFAVKTHIEESQPIVSVSRPARVSAAPQQMSNLINPTVNVPVVPKFCVKQENCESVDIGPFKKPVCDHSKLDMCETRELTDGETGISYETIFGKHCGPDLDKIVVEDPYLISESYQVNNFHEYLDLILKNCSNLTEVSILIAKANTADEVRLRQFEMKCQHYNVNFNWKLNENLHDRRVRFFYTKEVQFGMGRGMDIYKPKSNSSDPRKCRECTIVTIYKNPSNKSKAVERDPKAFTSTSGSGMEVQIQLPGPSPKTQNKMANSGSLKIQGPEKNLDKGVAVGTVQPAKTGLKSMLRSALCGKVDNNPRPMKSGSVGKKNKKNTKKKPTAPNGSSDSETSI